MSREVHHSTDVQQMTVNNSRFTKMIFYVAYTNWHHEITKSPYKQKLQEKKDLYEYSDEQIQIKKKRKETA